MAAMALDERSLEDDTVLLSQVSSISHVVYTASCVQNINITERFNA